MSLMSVVTIYDDEELMFLYGEALKKYAISLYPAFYTADGKPYYDGINTDTEKFLAHKASENGIVGPNISSDVFKEIYKRAYDYGYLAIAVVCPHSKYTPYCREAREAAKEFKRSIKYDFSTFKIYVIDSKTFACGTLLHALLLARNYVDSSCSSEIAVKLSKNTSPKNKTFIFTRSNVFGDNDKQELCAYRMYNAKLKKLVITNSHDSVKYDEFAEIICEDLKKSGKNYSVSVGANCEFAGNVLGRIEEKGRVIPVCTMQYGIATADVLGGDSMCIHI